MKTAIQSLQEQRLLLQMEYAAEREAYRTQAEQTGLQRRVKRGDAWYPVKPGRSFYNSLNQRCLELFRTQDHDVDHNFEYGKSVSLSVAGTAAKAKEWMGSVSFVDGDRMVVVVADNFPLADVAAEEHLAVQLSFDETSYRAMFDALARTIGAKGNRLAYLRDLFYSTQPTQHYVFPPQRFPWLNATQEQAVNMVLRAKDVAVVHGPPGTGKTTTLVEAIGETLRRESQVMVCAQSNMAVDWISEQLVDRGISVLRIGNPVRVNDKMLSFTYERRFEGHPDYPQLWAIRKAIRELRSRKRRADERYHQKLESLKGRAAELEIRIHTQLFGEARVIASTLVGASHRLLDGMKFNTLFIDEAAQALEAACWIPLRRCSRVVLAGDHRQLPPTVKSMAALKGGLGTTLMERIALRKPEVVKLLTVQYRMNDDIMRFSSDWFYDGRVESSPLVRHRSILDYDVPMQWIESTDIKSSESADSKSNHSPLLARGAGGEAVGAGAWAEAFSGTSLCNKAEAELTLQVLEDYFNKIGKTRILDERIDVGIISPYRAQVQYLRQQLRKRAFFKPYRHLIAVNTVDGFQGQERDIIVISLVRSNDQGQIGFLNDLRRMNVAITRARMKLIILGNPDTLTRHPFYRKLYEYVKHLKQT